MDERAYDLLPEGVLVVDEGRITYANDFLADLLGTDRERLVGAPLDDVLPGVDVTDEPDGTRHARAENGDILEVGVRFRPAGDRYVGVVQRVAGRRRHEETLERLQGVATELLGTDDVETLADVCVDAGVDVLESPIVGVHLYDEETDSLRPASGSPALAERVGDPPAFEERESHAWEAFAAAEPGEYVDPGAGAAYAGETAVGAELIHPLDGFGVLVVGRRESRPFSERERRLVELLATTLTVAIDRIHNERSLREQNQRLERLASTLSHDLRDPLNTAKMTRNLAADAADGEAGRYLDDLGEVLDRMEELIEGLLTLAREGKEVGDREPVEFGEVVEAAWTTVGKPTAALRVESSATVTADPERLRTLLENLLGNAVRHAGPEVTVTVGVSETATGFYVADDGPGIPVERREQVFEHGESGREDGTGLGLSIVQQIADAHDWSVRLVESAEGGARFEVTGLTGTPP